MLVIFIASVLILSAVGFFLVGLVVRAAMRRLRLEPWAVLVWFGVAETVGDEVSARRRAALAWQSPTADARY